VINRNSLDNWDNDACICINIDCLYNLDLVLLLKPRLEFKYYNEVPVHFVTF